MWTDAWTRRRYFRQVFVSPVRRDVWDRMLTNGSIQALQLDQIRTHSWHVLRCSAMTGKNLKEGLAWVVEDAKKRLFLY